MSDVLLVGGGGIGHPCALALARSNALESLSIVDEDEVELSNLHRQILFDEGDVGRSKVYALGEAIAERAPKLEVRAIEGRALPDTVNDLVRGARVVVDATDNFASRFLLADACYLARVPVVHAAAIRWNATVLASAATGGPCYRCLFEDLPRDVVLDCATGGIVGPICGVAGAIAADRALAILRGDERCFGTITTFDGRRDRLREIRVERRERCELCGAEATIRSIDEARYVEMSCDDTGEENGIDGSHPQPTARADRW